MTGTYKPVNEIEDVVVSLDCKKPMSKMVLGKYKKKEYLASPLLFVNKYIPKCFISVDNNESLFKDTGTSIDAVTREEFDELKKAVSDIKDSVCGRSLIYCPK